MIDLTKELRLLGNSIVNEYDRNKYLSLLSKAFSHFNINQEKQSIIILNELKQIMNTLQMVMSWLIQETYINMMLLLEKSSGLVVTLEILKMILIIMIIME